MQIVRGKISRAHLGAAVRRFASDCSGSTAIEYIIAVAIIGVAVLAGVSVLSGAVADLYGGVTALFGK
jgi:Flp pilus assembly pilin Flp